MDFIEQYLNESTQILNRISRDTLRSAIELIAEVRNSGGRIFFLGVGGGAGNANHAVNDFRKIAGIESYAVTDNVSELTARINDEGWDTSYVEWLKQSRLRENDMIFVFSVGGGNIENGLSLNIAHAVHYAKEVKAFVAGIVGRDDGETAKVADVCIIVPSPNPDTMTAHTESMQALLWHLIISHPTLYRNKMKWESVKSEANQ